jgi:hypothetical protein
MSTGVVDELVNALREEIVFGALLFDTRVQAGLLSLCRVERGIRKARHPDVPAEVRTRIGDELAERALPGVWLRGLERQPGGEAKLFPCIRDRIAEADGRTIWPYRREGT